MNAVTQAKPQQTLDLRLQNAQSLLRSTATTSSEKGQYGYVLSKETGLKEYDFIPGDGFQISVAKPLPEQDRMLIAQANKPASAQFIITQLSRLALHKHMRAGESTAGAYFSDLAHDIEYAGELSIVEACARLRRSSSPFFPASSEIIKTVELVSAEIMANLNPGKTQENPIKTPCRQEDWKKPTEQEIKNVGDMVSQIIKEMHTTATE